MGMFDTIYFEKPYICPSCNGKIDSVQVKEFENFLENYHIGDCVGHAEDIRIIKDELFCDKCKFTGQNVYIVVDRGILIGTSLNIEGARKLLESMNFEKLTLWYHDLYKRYINERIEKNMYVRFLKDLKEWYGEKLYEDPPTGLLALHFWNLNDLKGAKDPVESIERFLSYRKMIEALDELRNEGYDVLDIYYPEEMSPGEESWSVDVYNDEINERCDLNWTWTIINKMELEKEEEKEDEMEEWNIVVDEPFSEAVVVEAIRKWLEGRRYEFGVRMIDMDKARGSGLIKKLRDEITQQTSTR
ncbi:MAG: hypothetical protein OIN87_13460 [Candidatus Methanoperedens sp.]|nr:hypothetical protein [Candidatus Methanoperedens sp.]